MNGVFKVVVVALMAAVFAAGQGGLGMGGFQRMESEPAALLPDQPAATQRTQSDEKRGSKPALALRVS